MYHFQGIAVDAGVSVDGDCTMTHSVHNEGVDIDFGHGTGSLHLCLTENATVKLTDLLTVALADFRQHRVTCESSVTAMPDRDQR
jgi:hypothetical protein